MAINYEYKSIVVKKNHINDEVEYTRTDNFNNLDFNDLYLIEHMSKLSEKEELVWFCLMMASCFGFIIGIINYIPLCKS